MGSRKVGLALYMLLVFWFTLDLVGIPGFVTRDDWLSIAGLLELLLLIILIGYLRQRKYAAPVALVTLTLWGYLQYASHWHGFFFGASGDTLKRYYALFSGMYRFFPESDARIIPDAYHTILGFLLVINLMLLVTQGVWLYRSRMGQTAKPKS